MYYSEKLRELLTHLDARERASTFDTPMDRLKALCLGLDEEEITRLVSASIKSSYLLSGGDSLEYAVGLLTIGLELGHEFERRM